MSRYEGKHRKKEVAESSSTTTLNSYEGKHEKPSIGFYTGHPRHYYPLDWEDLPKDIQDMLSAMLSLSGVPGCNCPRCKEKRGE